MLQTSQPKYDFISDIHGCATELGQLLELLGYQQSGTTFLGHEHPPLYRHPEDRQVVFCGDYIDRGPQNLAVLAIVEGMVNAGNAYALLGNHDENFLCLITGKPVGFLGCGLETTMREVADLGDYGLRHLEEFFTSRPHYLWLDDQRVLATHAGLPPEYWETIEHPHSRYISLWGVQEAGIGRVNWARAYTGETLLVYGHTPQRQAVWQGNSINIDTAGVFGVAFTALRYPERELISVPSLQPMRFK